MTSETDQATGPARVLGAVALHPVLLAVYPGLALWAANVDEVLPAEVWPTLWLPVLAAGVVWAGAAVGLRSARRGAVVASLATVLALNAGRVVGGDVDTTVLLAAGAILLVGTVGVWWIPTGGMVPTTAIANVAALVLVLLAVPPILSAWGPGTRAIQVPAALEAVDGGLAGRDIWYIVPDRYPRADTLEEVFDFDNSDFLASLQDRGFQVAERSLANYPKTAHSLAATWNLAPIDELIPQPPADGSDWQPLYALLRDHRLGRTLTEVGYEYLHLGSWWSPTATAASADRVLRHDTTSEFASVWEAQTILPALAGTEASEGEPSLRQRHRAHTSYQLDALDRLARTPHDQPRFVLAHVTLPHEPYTFEADGSLATAEEARSRTRRENVTNQVTYLNSRLESLVDQLLSGPPETWPVIVIQSDEGPHPVPLLAAGPGYDWTSAPPEVLGEKLRTLSAILLPGADVELPEDLTGVNTWRYVLNATIGTDHEPIADPPVKAFPGEDQLYDLQDVSDRVR